MREKFYRWLLNNLPQRWMYVERQIDSQHTMWFPRFGYTKKQMEEAKERADKLFNGLKFK